MVIRRNADPVISNFKNSVAKTLDEKDIRKKVKNDKISLRRFAEGKEAKEEKADKEEMKKALLQDEDVKIVNADGTSGDHTDNDTPWRDFWEKETGVKLEEILDEKGGKFLCPGYEHHKNGSDKYVEPEKICGCHVQKADAKGNIIDETMYITPMCSGCNKRTNDIFKVGKAALVKRYKDK